MKIHRWWDQDPEETYWLEITDRPDVGADLHAPALDDSGRQTPSYQLVTEVGDGEIVFHYEKGTHAITGWSIAEGGSWEAETIWGTPRSTGRSGEPVTPYPRSGLWHGLKGPFALDVPVELEEIRASEDRLREIHRSLEGRFVGALYLAFQLRSDGVRASQGYLQKLPAQVVSHFPRLRSAARGIHGPARRRTAGDRSGVAYRPALAPRVQQGDPFSVDPAVVERGLESHARLQNLLVEAIESDGHSARSPGPSDPAWDVLWEVDGEIWVAEVKSLTDRNEERQLRLGLGQLLRYRQRLGTDPGVAVRAMLFVEREPADGTWMDLCDSLGVELRWPNTLRSSSSPAPLSGSATPTILGSGPPIGPGDDERSGARALQGRDHV